MASKLIKRTTLFKIPNEADIDVVLEHFEIMRKNAVKNGQPYIVSNSTQRVVNTPEPRSEGFTLVSQSIFKTYEDHAFYDQECPAHKALKEVIAKVRTGIVTILTEVDHTGTESA